jgi:hypothetical protein
MSAKWVPKSRTKTISKTLTLKKLQKNNVQKVTSTNADAHGGVGVRVGVRRRRRHHRHGRHHCHHHRGHRHRHHHRHHRTPVCASEYVEVYYHNTLIKSTKIEACCTLRIPFDIVFNALFNRGYHPIQPLQKCMFL